MEKSSSFPKAKLAYGHKTQTPSQTQVFTKASRFYSTNLMLIDHSTTEAFPHHVLHVLPLSKTKANCFEDTIAYNPILFLIFLIKSAREVKIKAIVLF